ncbi:MAG: hypothetical protein GEU26_19020 [Nitrososphaeraceae archaeon]|nr:hypothetical protein [Nitrososphaeraceae archaeon]
MYNFNPNYNTLVKAYPLDNNNDIKPILKKEKWKGEVPNPTFEGLSNPIIESNKTVGVWGPIWY